MFKPHKLPITSIAFSPDGMHLATGSQDGTVFYFKIKYHASNHNGNPVVNFGKQTVSFSPIGFVSLSGPVKSVAFSPDNHQNAQDFERTESFTNQYTDYGKPGTGRFSLILLEDGCLYSSIVPADGKYDNSVTFELGKDLLKLQKWNPHVNIPRSTVATPALQSVQKTPSSESKRTEDKSQLSADGNDAAALSQDIFEEDLPEEKRESITRRNHGLVLASESLITSFLYLEGGYLIASFVNLDGEGEIRALKVENPEISR